MRNVIHIPITRLDVNPFHIKYLLNFKYLTRKSSFMYKRTFGFTHESKYILPDPVEQKDWNKLCGVSFLSKDTITYRGMVNKVMAVWRYNPEDDLFEIGPYYHDRYGSTVFPSDLEATLQIPAGVYFEVNILVSLLTYPIISITTPKRDIAVMASGIKTSKVVREVTSYFGGTLRPPHVVKYRKG